LLAVVGGYGGPFGLLAAYFAALPLFAVGFAAGTRACLAAAAALATGSAIGATGLLAATAMTIVANVDRATATALLQARRSNDHGIR
jgi:hypothetical protein